MKWTGPARVRIPLGRERERGFGGGMVAVLLDPHKRGRRVGGKERGNRELRPGTTVRTHPPLHPLQ